jgi:hypothetical protein
MSFAADGFLTWLTECLDQIGQPAGEKTTSDRSTFSQMLSLRIVHLLAFFIFVYVGVEVTIGGLSFHHYRSSAFDDDCPGGWIVTYVIEVRGGGPSSGYISSGFFGGQCLFFIPCSALTSAI